MTTAITLRQVSKAYAHYDHMTDRLREIITGKRRHQERVALHPLSLKIGQGEVVGVIGRNGAGKSTLLKLVAGMLQPTSGKVVVKGRVAALLQLGGGFHPEMTGRENVYLAGTILGLTEDAITTLYPSIVEFAGLGEVMEEPVKTYSSGMFMRLAFAVATCIEPDILIIDEALSVGDGAFSRKSFDRIMEFREAGKTIFFCSHALYQVEAICTRALWFDRGVLKRAGDPATVVTAYKNFLDAESGIVPHQAGEQDKAATDKPSGASSGKLTGMARITAVETSVDGVAGHQLQLISGRSDVTVRVSFASDKTLPSPTLGVGFMRRDGLEVTSATTYNDRVTLHRDSEGNGTASITFPSFPLLKGEYQLHVYLLCENAVHVYDSNKAAATLHVTQNGFEPGVVQIPHQWCPTVD